MNLLQATSHIKNFCQCFPLTQKRESKRFLATHSSKQKKNQMIEYFIYNDADKKWLLKISVFHLQIVSACYHLIRREKINKNNIFKNTMTQNSLRITDLGKLLFSCKIFFRVVLSFLKKKQTSYKF